MKTYFLNRNKTNNIGDIKCSPRSYFNFFSKNNEVDILYRESNNPLNWLNEIKLINSNIIIGGGGLLDRETFKKPLFRLLKNDYIKKKIIWGAGHNSKSLIVNDINILSQLNKIDLVGIRDFKFSKKHNFDFVPCVSCMDPIFDNNKTKILNEIVVIEHEHIPLDIFSFPKLKNNASFIDTINFIKQSDKIITNSYHVMYWSILLNKKVVVVPNSSKFFDFIYTPKMINSIRDINLKNDFKCINFNVLEDCRSQNLMFFEKVKNYLLDE
jgi:hypothetical protein|tara:strand:+ start:1642 stop:2448 length:807 start_codon:yes stop_codon:yes gene_type:complete